MNTESFEKLPQVENLHIGCAFCSTSARIAPMGMLIAVGFGCATVTKNGDLVYSEDEVENEEFWTVEDAEKLATQEPNADWRIEKHGALHGETFQRQGEGNWVCIESNAGFA